MAATCTVAIAASVPVAPWLAPMIAITACNIRGDLVAIPHYTCDDSHGRARVCRTWHRLAYHDALVTHRHQHQRRHRVMISIMMMITTLRDIDGDPGVYGTSMLSDMSSTNIVTCCRYQIIHHTSWEISSRFGYTAHTSLLDIYCLM